MAGPETEMSIIQKIMKKRDNPELFSQILALSMSEINSLLLEVFRKKTKEMTPAELLRQYAQNRFTRYASSIIIRETLLTFKSKDSFIFPSRGTMVRMGSANSNTDFALIASY